MLRGFAGFAIQAFVGEVERSIELVVDHQRKSPTHSCKLGRQHLSLGSLNGLHIFQASSGARATRTTLSITICTQLADLIEHTLRSSIMPRLPICPAQQVHRFDSREVPFKCLAGQQQLCWTVCDPNSDQCESRAGR